MNDPVICPNCGSDDLGANTVEAWCFDCDQLWTKSGEPDICTAIRYTAIREQLGGHRDAVAARFDRFGFRANREAVGLNQAQLGAYLGVKQATISRWESGMREIPPGVQREVSDLLSRVLRMAARAADTIEDVKASGHEDPYIFIYTSSEQMAKYTDLDEDFPLESHRVAMAIAANETNTALIERPPQD